LPETAPDRDELALFLDGVLASAGPGSVLVCGEEDGRTAPILAMSGMAAVRCPGLPDVAALAPRKFDVVLLWHVLDRLEAPDSVAALQRLRARVSRALVIRTDGTTRRSGPRGEKWLEEAALEAGYRKHPLYLQLSPYERRETDGPDDVLLLEPIADEIVAKFPLASLGAGQGHDRDMLRESGRESDASVERYRLALQFIRPGDTVLDLSCGLGYGSHVLYQGSAARRVIGVDARKPAIAYAKGNYALRGRVEFKAGDPQRLQSLANHSADLVLAVEPLEPESEPLKFLDEARRVLRPGGRVVACVPAGYSWARLRGEVAERFLVERAYRQAAGGGPEHADARRQLREFPASQEPQEAQWLIVVGMRDPVGGEAVPYVESTFTGYEELEGFHVARFDGDYENPWLVKALVSIGFRFDEPAGLLELAWRVRDQATPGSADEGAALCVEGYANLQAPGDGAAERPRLRAAIAAYVEKAGDRPHQVRWKISNLYVQALLHLADQDFDAARQSFERCAAMDPAPFSPLLATKTIGAAYFAGLLAALAGDRDRARQLWAGGIRTTHAVFAADWTNVIGTESNPLYFGLPEVAIAVSKGSKCAYALQALDSLEHRPGRLWVEISRDIETQFARETRALRHVLGAMRSAHAQADAAAGSAQAVVEQQGVLDRQASAITQMHGAFAKQARTIAELQAAVLERDQALGEQSRTLAQQREAFEAQARNIDAIREQLNARDSALTAQGETITQMRRSFEEQAHNIATLNATILERERALAEKSEAFTAQARNIAALRDQLNAKDAGITKQVEALARMQESFEQQAASIAKLNAAVLEREKLLAEKTAAFEAQARNIAAIREQLNARESALATQGETITRMRHSFAEQAQSIGKLNAAILEREKALVEKSEAFGAQAAGMTKLTAALAEKAGAFEAQARHIAEFSTQLNARDAALAKQGETIAQMHASFEQQSKNIARLNAAILERDQSLADQSAEFARQREASEAQASDIAALKRDLGQGEAELAQVRRSLEALRAQSASELQALRAQNAAEVEALRARSAADLEREAQSVARLEASLAERTRSLTEAQALAAAHARTVEQRDADLAREREVAGKLNRKLQETETALAKLEARLQALRVSRPYRLLRRWMEREEDR
jgi:SAM-dependent methyltransferase